MVQDKKTVVITDTLHLRIKKEYAVALIEDLIKAEAIEFVDDTFKLTSAQKVALNKELNAIENDSNYLLKWDEIKHRFRKP